MTNLIETSDGFSEVDIIRLQKRSEYETKIRIKIDGKYYTGVLEMSE